MTEPCEAGPASGAFSVSGESWRYTGALTLENAAAVMSAADALALPADGRVDFTELGPADSAALAVIMALRRRALHEGRALHVEGLPPGLASLAIVYGVEDLARGTA